MLGEKIAEAQGKVIGTRVLPDGRVEVSVQESGQILGVDDTEIATFWSEPRPGGVMYGEGQGVLMTKDGETVSFKGSGVGKPTGVGMGATWRAALTYQTASQRLARLNGVVGIIEFEVDANGNTRGKVWEWK